MTDLVRGTLCPAIKAVLEHGMKRPNFLGGPCHPWLFIEEASTREVEKDFNSVYSRLVLCKTYRLDEDGKVLTPEEVSNFVGHLQRKIVAEIRILVVKLSEQKGLPISKTFKEKSQKLFRSNQKFFYKWSLEFFFIVSFPKV